MPKIPRSVLKEYFQSGDKPTAPQFGNMLDSMVNFIDDRDFIGLRIYNSDADYLPGDCAVFNDQVVKCITATTGTFNPADWTVLASFGSVNYAGTWDTQANVPVLQSSIGTKGFYYVVINASPDPNDNTSLNGTNDWGTGDWAIFNGSIWEKVDNSETPVPADNVSFNPTPEITSTNVQDAIVEVNTTQTAAINSKVNKAGDSMTGFLVLNADPVNPLEAVTKQYCDDLYDNASVQISNRVARTGDTMTGDLILNGDPVPALAAVPKQYVDAIAATINTNVSGKVNRAGDTMTGALILDADPLNVLGAVTKQYADAIQTALTASVNAKVSKSGDTMTGALVLNADPVNALEAATKQYTDTGLTLKLNLSGGTMTGNLVLNANPASALGAATKQYVDAINTSLSADIAGKVNKSGDTMTGLLTLSGDPVSALQAATRQYVDNATKKLVIPFTFNNEYVTNASSFSGVPLQVTIPAAATVFAGATAISARLSIDYLLESGSVPAQGEAGLTEWTAATSGSPSLIAGSSISMTGAPDTWRKATTVAQFVVTEEKTYRVIFRKTAGSGGARIRMEAASLTLYYS